MCVMRRELLPKFPAPSGYVERLQDPAAAWELLNQIYEPFRPSTMECSNVPKIGGPKSCLGAGQDQPRFIITETDKSIRIFAIRSERTADEN